MTGRFAFDVIAQGEHDFRDRFVFQALFEAGEIELVGTDAVDGREAAVKDVVGAAIGRGTFDRHQVGDLFDDTDGGGLALDVETDGAELGFGQAAATGATPDGGGGGLQ